MGQWGELKHDGERFVDFAPLAPEEHRRLQLS